MPISVHIAPRHLKLQKLLFPQIIGMKMLYYPAHVQDVSSSHCVGFTQFSSPTPQLFQVYLQKDLYRYEKHHNFTAQKSSQGSLAITQRKEIFLKDIFFLLMLYGHKYLFSRPCDKNGHHE